MATHWIRLRGQPEIVLYPLPLDHTALWNLSLARAPLHWLRRSEANTRMARALIGQLPDTEHLRVERRQEAQREPATLT